MTTKSKREKIKSKRKPRVPKPTQKQKQKQNVKQETNVNIKIGDVKPKRKYNRKQNPKPSGDQQQQHASHSFVFNPTILTQQPSMVPVTYNPPVYQIEPKKAESSPIASPVVTPGIITLRELTENTKMKTEDLRSKRIRLSNLKESGLNVDKIMNKLKNPKNTKIDNTPFSGQVSAGLIPSEAPSLMTPVQEIKSSPSQFVGGSIQHAIKKYESDNSEGERIPSRKGRTLPFTSPSPVQANAVLAGGGYETGYETAVPLGPVRMLSQNPNAVAARERRRKIKEGTHIVKSRKKKQTANANVNMTPTTAAIDNHLNDIIGLMTNK